MAVALPLALALVVFGPPGVDAAAHHYLTDRFAADGWRFWDNYWYAGRYELVNYSLLFYPVAVVVGPVAVAVGAIVAGAGLFSSLLTRAFGAQAIWPSRLFAISWPALLVAGQYPFALGTACALAALVALQRAHPWLGLALAALALGSSPLAFLFMLVALSGIVAVQQRQGRLDWARTAAPMAGLLVLGLVQLAALRAFPTEGTFPYPWLDLVGISLFSLAGIALARGSERARPLLGVFAAYLVLGWLAKLAPGGVGGNASRLLQYYAVPLLVLAIAVRGRRLGAPAIAALAVALAWQVVPLLRNAANAQAEPAKEAAFWDPAVAFLGPGSERFDLDHRVEAVATWGHWESYHLAGRGVPIVRGWFRQDDFPQNETLYDSERLDARSYLAWLHELGVRYVVLPARSLDASAEREADLLRAGVAGVSRVKVTEAFSIFEVDDPRPVLELRGPSSDEVRRRTRVIRLEQSGMWVYAPVAGEYLLRFRYTPYWRVDSPGAACVRRGPGWMSVLLVNRPGPVRISFDVSLGQAASTVAGDSGSSCAVFPPAEIAS